MIDLFTGPIAASPRQQYLLTYFLLGMKDRPPEKIGASVRRLIEKHYSELPVVSQRTLSAFRTLVGKEAYEKKITEAVLQIMRMKGAVPDKAVDRLKKMDVIFEGEDPATVIGIVSIVIAVIALVVQIYDVCTKDDGGDTYIIYLDDADVEYNCEQESEEVEMELEVEVECVEYSDGSFDCAEPDPMDFSDIEVEMEPIYVD